MNKYYILVQNNEEYNDEVYSIQGGGEPECVYTDIEKAVNDADHNNWQKFRGLELSNYCYELGEVATVSDDELLRVLKDLFPKQEFEEDYIILPKMTFKQYQALKPYINLEFYSVKEVKGQ